MLVLTRSRGRPSSRVCMSSTDEIATPTRPTSPRAIGASLSYPIWVGRSNATLSPSLPWAKRYLNRRFVSFAVPKPAYWRIVQSRPRYIVGWIPRVNGESPGNPRPSRYASAFGSRAATTSKATPLPVVLDAFPTTVAPLGDASRRRRFVFRCRAMGSVSIRRPSEAELRQGHAAAANDLSDDPCVHVGLEGPNDGLRGRLRCNDRETHSHVERLIHLPVFDSSERLQLAEHGRDVERFRDTEFDLRLEADQVAEPASGDVSHAMNVPASEGAQDRPDVDGGGLEELLAPGTPGSADLVEHGQRRVVQHSASERQAVRVDPAARQADDHVSRADRTTVDDLRLPNGPEAGAPEVEFPHELGDHRDLPADDRYVRHLGPAVQPDANLTGDLAVVSLDRDVVDEGNRLRADADHVVHVHRDAVNPDRVPAAHLLRNKDLRPDAVGAQGERVVAEVDESREVTDLGQRLPQAATTVGEGGDEGGDVRGLFVLAHAGVCVGPDHIARKRPRLFQGCAGPGQHVKPVVERVYSGPVASFHDGQGLGQGAETRSILSSREETVVPEPRGDQAVADRPAIWLVRIGRRRRGPRRGTRRLVPGRTRAHRGEGARHRGRPRRDVTDRGGRDPSGRLHSPRGSGRVVRDAPEARRRRDERHGPETQRQPIARRGADPRPGGWGPLLRSALPPAGWPVPGEGVPGRRIPAIRSPSRRALRGDERRQADRFHLDECGDLRPRDGAPLGRRAPRNRPGPLEALLGFLTVSEASEDFPSIQPGRDILGPELRRLRVALVGVLEPVHPRVHDAFVVPGDRVLRPDLDRLVVAVEGLRQEAFLEIHRAEVAPRDLVLRVQADRVLMAPQRLIKPPKVRHRDAARRPGV